MAVIKLVDACTEYQRHLTSRGLAAGTVRSKMSSLQSLIKVAGNKPVHMITGIDVDRVFDTFSAWTHGTRNKRVSDFRSFFGWCRARKYMPQQADPLFGYRLTATPETQRTRIPRSDWPKIFDVCTSAREQVVIATGLYLFLRASEQQAIQIKHIHLDDCEIEIYRRKVKHWDTMPISAELDPYLRAQMTAMSEQFDLKPDHYLIPARFKDLKREPNGRLIKGSGTIDPTRPFPRPHLVVQDILGRAGYPRKREGEHTLRRSGSRAYFDLLAESGYDGALRRVQAMLGHKNSLMTEVYLGLDLDRRRRNLELRGQRMFPVIDTSNVVNIKEAARG